MFRREEGTGESWAGSSGEPAAHRTPTLWGPEPSGPAVRRGGPAAGGGGSRGPGPPWGHRDASWELPEVMA